MSSNNVYIGRHQSRFLGDTFLSWRLRSSKIHHKKSLKFCDNKIAQDGEKGIVNSNQPACGDFTEAVATASSFKEIAAVSSKDILQLKWKASDL